MKIGNYTDDEILEFMTEGEGRGFLGRSMLDAMYFEIERLNNIINKVKQQLLNKKDIVEKSKYFKLVYYTDWNMEHEWDKSIVDKIDEIINIIDEDNK